MRNNTILIGGAVIFRDYRGKRQFLVARQNEKEGWEIPKVTVRRGESSVRAVLRMVGEQGGINAKVLEEAGRSVGSTVINGKSVTQKYFYYLLVQKSSGEILGFEEHQWMEYGKAVRLLYLKKEKTIFKQGKQVLRMWEKQKQKKD